MGKTSIQWTDHSINPIRARDTETGNVGHACVKISTGCAHCYSSKTQRRFGMPEFTARIGPTIEAFLDESKLQEVMRRRKPTKYFWCDMTDLFGDWVEDRWVDRCFAVMALTPQHTHQVLTKRPDRALAYFRRSGIWNVVHEFVGPTISSADDVTKWCRKHGVEEKERYRRVNVLNSLGGFTLKWPLPNVWLGVSCETQEFADLRIPILLDCPAAVRFLSLEPLLGPINLTKLHNGCGETYDCLKAEVTQSSGNWFRVSDHKPIDWVIVGGESGRGARQCNSRWISNIVKDCRTSNTAVFVKQLGSRPYTCNGGHDSPAELYGRPVDCGGGAGYGCESIVVKDSKGGDMDEWPESLRVREMPSYQVSNSL